MKTYKVWISVEQCDEEQDEYLDLSGPDAAVAEFTTPEEAQAFAEQLQHHGYVASGHWPEWAGEPKRREEGQ